MSSPDAATLADVAWAVAALAGYGAVHIDAVSRELGWNVERRRETVGRALKALVDRGLAVVPEDPGSPSPLPRYVYGLTREGRHWLDQAGRGAG